MQISQLFDRLVGSAHAADQETLYKARILAGIVAGYIVLLLLTSVYLIGFTDMALFSAMFTALLLFSMVAGYAYVLRELKFGKHYQRCVDLTVLFTSAGILTGMASSGGPIAAPATPLILIPVVLAFSLGTRHSGLKWAGIIFLVHFAMIVVDQWLFRFPQLLDTSRMLTYHIMHWAVAYFAILFLMLIFESTTRRLKQERDAERDRYAYLAAHDPLTGLANRSMFDAQLPRALASSDRNKNIVGLMMIDLDGFKPVNDRLGHDAGDLVLRTISSRLQGLLRKTDTIARMGGDEFAVILENVITPPGVEIVAERIIAEINKPYEGLPADVKIGASVGIAMYPEHSRDAERLRVFADHAMYAAKAQHNCFRIFSPAMESMPG